MPYIDFHSIWYMLHTANNLLYFIIYILVTTTSTSTGSNSCANQQCMSVCHTQTRKSTGTCTTSSRKVTAAPDYSKTKCSGIVGSFESSRDLVIIVHSHSSHQTPGIYPHQRVDFILSTGIIYDICIGTWPQDSGRYLISFYLIKRNNLDKLVLGVWHTESTSSLYQVLVQYK